MRGDSTRGSNQPKSQQEKRHREIDRMLPWYINGTLESSELRRVEQHLAECTHCRDEVAHCRRLASAIQEVGDVAPEPHPVQLARLMRQIGPDWDHDAAGSGPARLPRLWRRLQELFTATPRGLRWTLAAQSALLVLLAVALLRSGSESRFTQQPHTTAQAPTRATFHTLSDPGSSPGSTTAASGVERALLRVVFDPDLPEQAIRETLLKVRAEIVGGPSTIGVYTLAVPTQGAGATPVTELLAHLRARSGVQFAQPVASSDDGGR